MQRQRGYIIIKVKYKVIRSKRKTLALSVNKELEVIVRVPNKTKEDFIKAFVNKNTAWIESQKEKIEKRNKLKEQNALSKEQIEELKVLAKDFIPRRVEYYRKIMGISVSGIKITSAKSRWGSCSYKNSLCFSYRIMLLNKDLIDAIVVHELAHVRVKNHGKYFYEEIYKYMPDYEIRNKEIKDIERQLP